jgi:hypothetical protein
MARRERCNRHRIIALADLSPFPRESRLRAARWRTRIARCALVVSCPLGRLGILGNGLSNRGGRNPIALAGGVDLRPYDTVGRVNTAGDVNNCDLGNRDPYGFGRGCNRRHKGRCIGQSRQPHCQRGNDAAADETCECGERDVLDTRAALRPEQAIIDHSPLRSSENLICGENFTELALRVSIASMQIRMTRFN